MAMEKGSKQARLVVVETLTKSTETCPLHWTHWIVLTRAGMDTLYSRAVNDTSRNITVLNEGPYTWTLSLLKAPFVLKQFTIY